MIAIGASTYTIIHSLIQKEKETFKPQVENILKEAVINNIAQKTKGLALNGLSNSPKKIGTYETRTFCSKDTLFTYQHKIQDIDTEILFTRQLGLLIMDSLQSCDIYNPQIQISAESETKRSIFREKDKTKRSKKESAQHSKSRNKSFVMTSVSAL